MKAIKLLSALAIAVSALGLSSCGCCTSETAAKPLPPKPVFKDLHAPIHYSK